MVTQTALSPLIGTFLFRIRTALISFSLIDGESGDAVNQPAPRSRRTGIYRNRTHSPQEIQPHVRFSWGWQTRVTDTGTRQVWDPDRPRPDIVRSKLITEFQKKKNTPKERIWGAFPFTAQKDLQPGSGTNCSSSTTALRASMMNDRAH